MSKAPNAERQPGAPPNEDWLDVPAVVFDEAPSTLVVTGARWSADDRDACALTGRTIARRILVHASTFVWPTPCTTPRASTMSARAGGAHQVAHGVAATRRPE